MATEKAKKEAPDASQTGPMGPELVPADGAVAVAEKRVIPLSIDRWKFGDFGCTLHTVYVPARTDFETVCRPEFWANLTRLVVDDIIHVRTDDKAWFAELMVLAKERNSATVAVLREPVALIAAFKPLPGARRFDVQFAGAHGQWRVIRLSDKNVIKDSLATEGIARKWLDDYERLVAA